ncbi:MAG: hypothetical protein GQ574_00060 [Crocinitomix sp.]|nr:hypothetical protein [Crocinitomix sp.]
MHKILFFDASELADFHNVSFELNTPVKLQHNPVLTKDQPWESLICTYGSVIKDSDHYKMYYTQWWLDEKEPYDCLDEAIAYAESEDGLIWKKPNLNNISKVNNGNNNLLKRVLSADQPCVIKRDIAVGDKQYVMAYYGDFEPLGKGVRIAFSPDGVNWDLPGDVVWQTPIDKIAHNLSFYAADDTINFYFDPGLNKYILLRKVMYDGELVYDEKSHKDLMLEEQDCSRMIARCESIDLVNWTNHEIILKPKKDNKQSDYHRLSITPYYNYYIGLLEIFHHKNDKNTVDIHLLYSKDSKTWIHPNESIPFIANGNKGEWDGGVLFVQPTFIQEEKTIKIFYGGMDARMDEKEMAQSQAFGVGLAELTKDRFSAVRFNETEGSVLILIPDKVGMNVYINAISDAKGAIKVALLDGNKKEIDGCHFKDCDTISSNAIAEILSWSNEKRIPSNTQFISLSGALAKIYSLTFTK